jgi:hypothetical protein
MDNIAILDLDPNDNRNKYVDDDTYLDQLEFILKGIDDGDIQSSDLHNILDNNFDDEFDFSKGKENLLPNPNASANNNNFNGKGSNSMKPNTKGISGLRSTGESPIHKKRNDKVEFHEPRKIDNLEDTKSIASVEKMKSPDQGQPQKDKQNGTAKEKPNGTTKDKQNGTTKDKQNGTTKDKLTGTPKASGSKKDENDIEIASLTATPPTPQQKPKKRVCSIF